MMKTIPQSGEPASSEFEAQQQDFDARAERIRGADESSLLITWVARADGRMLSVADRWLDMMGVAREDATIDAWTALVHAEDVAPLRDAWARATGTSGPFECDYRIRVVDGTWRWMRSRARPSVADDGTALWFGTTEDIHDRKVAELANAQLAAIVSASADAILSYSPEGLIETWNPAAERLFGYAASEAIGQPVSLLIPPGAPEGPRGIFSRSLQGETVRIDTARLAKGGALVDVAITASPICAAGGIIVGVSATFRDIRERKEAERALREREAELARVQRIAGVGGLEVDLRDGFRNRRSPEYLRLHGLPPDAADESHEAWVRRIHPEDRERTEAAFRQAIAGRDCDYSAEYRIITPAGDLRWISASAEIERAPDGKAIRLVGAHLDVTARKRAEAALRESEELLRLALAAASAGAFAWDFETGRLTWSSENAEILGEVSSDAAFDPRTFLARMVHARDRDRVEREALDAHSGGAEAFQIEFRVLHPSRGQRWMLVQGRIERASDGRPRRCSGLNLDITERKRSEESQQILMAELDHRVKNVLATIQAMVRRTATGKGTPQELASVLNGRIAAMARAHTLLASNRWQGASFREIVADEFRPYGVDQISLSGPDIVLTPRAATSLSLAVHELTTNAAKYGALSVPAGRVDVTWSIEAEPAQMRFVWTERGGPPTVPPSRQGFGSTLIARVIRHEFDGSSTFEFLPGGLTCSIVLPLDAIQADGAARQMAGPGMPEADWPVADLAGARILVVEDTSLIALEVEEILMEAGAVVIGPIANLDAALVAAQGEAIDGALLDVNLAGQAVFPVADILAERGIPLVFATGYDAVFALPHRFFGRPRLRKPYAAGDLLRTLAAALHS